MTPRMSKRRNSRSAGIRPGRGGAAEEAQQDEAQEEEAEDHELPYDPPDEMQPPEEEGHPPEALGTAASVLSGPGRSGLPPGGARDHHDHA